MREVRQLVVRTASSCFGGHTSVGATAVGSVRGARTPACRAHTHVGACASNAMRRLAAFGVFTATAYSVRRRTKEFGIRMALGALPRRILAAVVWKTAKLTGVRCAAGLGAALAL